MSVEKSISVKNKTKVSSKFMKGKGENTKTNKSNKTLMRRITMIGKIPSESSLDSDDQIKAERKLSFDSIDL